MSGQGRWNMDNPGRGDVAQINDFAMAMVKRVEGLERIAAGSLRAADATEAGGFSGLTGSTWREAVRALGPAGSSAIIEVLRRRTDAAFVYSGEVSAIQWETAQARDLKSQAVSARHAWEGAGPEYQNRYDGQHRLQQIEEMESTSRHRLHVQTGRRLVADAAFIAALNDVPGFGGMSAESLVLAGARMPDAIAFADAEKARADAQAVKDAVDATRGLSEDYNDPAKLAGLEAALKALGDDEVLWNAYYDDIDPEALMTLINQMASATKYPIGDEVSHFDMAAAIASELRGGLAVASQNWDAARGAQFAQELIDNTWGRTAADITFLFADPNHACMGETLTVAMATKIDVLEREENDWRFGVDNTIFSSEGVDVATASLSEALADPADGLTRGIFGDTSATVFWTLSKYPNQTADWLLGGPAGDGDATARMEYWYGERDSSHSSFLGELAMLEGAQYETGPGGNQRVSGPEGVYGSFGGGVLDFQNPDLYDPEVWKHTATIMSDGLDQLTRVNGAFGPDWVGRSGAAAQAGAHVVANYMPMLAETALTGDAAALVHDAGNNWALTSLVNTDGSKRYIATIDRDELGLFARACADDPGAARILAEGSMSYSNVVFDQMDAFARNNDPSQLVGIDIGSGLERIFKSQGMVTAIVAGREAEVTGNQAENLAELFNMATGQIGKVIDLGDVGGDLVGVGSDGLAGVYTDAMDNLAQDILKDNIYIDRVRVQSLMLNRALDSDWAMIGPEGDLVLSHVDASGAQIPIAGDYKKDAVSAALGHYEDAIDTYSDAIYKGDPRGDLQRARD